MRRGIGRLRAGGSGFSPLSLFAAGEQGGWYDPSDLSSMFSDSAGTTPAVLEQPVGLMLDKRLGLALGSEICPNGSFNDATGWTLNAGATISGGTLNFTAAASLNPNAFISLTGAASGDVYRITFTVSGYSVGGVAVKLFTSAEQSLTFSANGTYTITQSVATSNGNFSFVCVGASTTLSIDNVSVKKITGNHLIQATAASRPTLSARYNRLTKTEAFDDAAWAKTNVTVTANAFTDPIGGSTADSAAAIATANASINYNGGATFPATSMVRRVYLRSGSLTSASLSIFDNTAGAHRATSATIISGPGAVALGATIAGIADVTGLTSSWTLVELRTTTAVVGNAMQSYCYLKNVSVAPTAGENLGIWGDDLRTSADAALSIPTYQRVDTASSYDISGFPMYLSFDGVDDTLKTSAAIGLNSPTVFWSVGSTFTTLPATNCIWDATKYSTKALLTTIRFTTSGAKDYDDATFALVASDNVVVGGLYDAAFSFTPRKNAVARTPVTGTIDSAVAETFISVYATNSVGGLINGRLYQFVIRKAVTDAATMTAVDRYVGSKMGIAL